MNSTEQEPKAARMPRYRCQHEPDGWWIIDRDLPALEPPLAILQDRLCAEDACAALNRGLAETVDSSGRWHE